MLHSSDCGTVQATATYPQYVDSNASNRRSCLRSKDFANKMYRPLDESKNQIRLVHLLPGIDSDDLHCRFSMISLDDDSSFEALSYVWGDEKDRMPVQVEGKEVTVTRNLYQALKSLRYEEKERVIWADALCINQRDAIERGSQVKLMGHLYSQTDCVVCYLGESSEGVELAMLAMQQLEENRDLHFLEWWKLDGFPNLKGPKASTPWLLRCIMQFFKAPWWTRAWTVQEFLLARRAVLQYGRTLLPAEAALKLPIIFNNHLMGCCKEFCSVVYRIVRDPESGESIGHFLGNTIQLLYQHRALDDSSLFYALALFRGRNAGDTRDKVYGMLGLAKKNFKPIQTVQPDYSLSVEEVFSHSATAEIARTRSLETLSYCYGDRKLNLPSWVPDWTADVTRAESRLRWVADMRFYKASGDSEAELPSNIKGCPGNLECSGIELDRIVQCGRRLNSHGRLTQTSVMNEMRSIARLDESGAAPYLNSGYTIEEAFKLSLCGSLEPWVSEMPGSGKEAFLGFRRLANEHELSHVESWEKRRKEYDPTVDLGRMSYRPPELRVLTMFQLFSSLAGDRRFIRTQKGYIGFGPASCARGDSVMVLSGGKVPYVLRQRYIDREGRRFYRLLGDGYVQGIMDGEAYVGICSGGERLETFNLE